MDTKNMISPAKAERAENSTVENSTVENSTTERKEEKERKEKKQKKGELKEEKKETHITRARWKLPFPDSLVEGSAEMQRPTEAQCIAAGATASAGPQPDPKTRKKQKGGNMRVDENSEEWRRAAQAYREALQTLLRLFGCNEANW